MTIVLGGYHFDTLAYYVKRLTGYDTLMSGTLKNLNRAGEGQLVGRTHRFQTGESVTLDGVMFDDNQVLMFYTYWDPQGGVKDREPMTIELRGSFGQNLVMRSGQGEMNDQQTELRWMVSFDPPPFWMKTLCWEFVLPNEQGAGENGSITFKLDRAKAMGRVLKKDLNDILEIDETRIRLESLVAAPTSTELKGTLQTLPELARDHISGERFMPDNLDFRLIADGWEVPVQGSELGTDMNGMRFEARFDALPRDVKDLRIKLVSFCADHQVDERILLTEARPIRAEILGQTIEINDIEQGGGEIRVTLTTEEGIRLTRVFLDVDGRKAELLHTDGDIYDKQRDGTVIHTRTLHFDGLGEDLTLDIHRMKWQKVYNIEVNVPLE